MRVLCKNKYSYHLCVRLGWEEVSEKFVAIWLALHPDERHIHPLVVLRHDPISFLMEMTRIMKDKVENPNNDDIVYLQSLKGKALIYTMEEEEIKSILECSINMGDQPITDHFVRRVIGLCREGADSVFDSIVLDIRNAAQEVLDNGYDPLEELIDAANDRTAAENPPRIGDAKA